MKKPLLIMVVGLPGTGKSTFSRALAERRGATHLNSDVIRAEIGLRGKYDPADKARVYAILQERTEALLRSGKTVIVDATLYRQGLRQPYHDLARSCGCPLRWIELQTGMAAIKDRVSRKRPYSEADLAVYEKIKALYEPLPEPYLILETDALALNTLVETAEEFLDNDPTAN